MSIEDEKYLLAQSRKIVTLIFDSMETGNADTFALLNIMRDTYRRGWAAARADQGKEIESC